MNVQFMENKVEREITDNELQVFCEWFKSHFRKQETFASAILISMSGYFHTLPKQAKQLLKRCESLNLITTDNNKVFLK